MNYGRQELAAAVAAEGLRPTLAEGAPPALAALLRACWAAAPAERPAAAAVAAALAAAAASLAAVAGAAPPPRLPPLDADVAAAATAAAALLAAAVAVPARDPAWALEPLAAAAAAPPAPVGSYATAGLRGEDKMEDRCLVARGACGRAGCVLAGVFDGHRGAEAAEYLLEALERHVTARWADSAGPGALLRAALLDADAAFRARAEAEWARGGGGTAARRFPGAAAVAALLTGRRLAVAWLGDCRAVLCRGGAALALTSDHAAGRADERARVLAAGGAAAQDAAGAWRVGAVGLAVTRSLGDADLKGCGVSADADSVELDLTDDDSFLVLGSDGLWERVDGADAVALVHDTVKSPALCAQRLVAEALARGSRDNASAVVAFLPGGASAAAGTAERVFAAGEHKYGGGAAARRVAARVLE
jgi:serine/threonine protein phosphatase PrpC